MKSLCLDCSSIKRQQGKELKNIPNQVSLHKRLHPTHVIRVIESDDYDQYGLKIRTPTYQGLLIIVVYWVNYLNISDQNKLFKMWINIRRNKILQTIEKISRNNDEPNGELMLLFGQL
jgi:hypothetical protein